MLDGPNAYRYALGNPVKLIDPGGTKNKPSTSQLKPLESKSSISIDGQSIVGRSQDDELRTVPLSTDEEIAAGGFRASDLPELEGEKETAFMREVYRSHLHLMKTQKSTSTFFEGVPTSDLVDIGAGYQLQKDAADEFQKMMKALKADLAAELKKASPDARAQRTSLGLSSAYRSAEYDLKVWFGQVFPKYYVETAAQRKATGDPLGPQAVEIMAKRLRSGKAVPGYSEHTHGQAVDFEFPESGTGYKPELTREQKNKFWDKTWLHDWLKANADRFDFHPLATERWHWEWSP